MDDSYKLYVKTFFGYYITRFNYEIRDIYKEKSFSGIFKKLASRFNEKPSYFKNLRDEFDPKFPQNNRKGWYQKGELSKGRLEVFEHFQKLSDKEVHKIADDLYSYHMNEKFDDFLAGLNFSDSFIDLKKLIQEVEDTYNSEFCYKDIVLSDDFKRAYSAQMKAEGARITFAEYSALLITSKENKIFIPNQWFVIASYALPLYLALQAYKSTLQRAMDEEGLLLGQECKKLKNTQDPALKERFHTIFTNYLSKAMPRDRANAIADKLLLFVTDYKSWHGQKTIDRNDFFYSPILNILNLVNASQSYVAQIVSYYSINEELRNEFSNSGKFNIARDETQKKGDKESLSDSAITSSVPRVNNSEKCEKEEITEIKKVRRIKIPSTALNQLTSRRIHNG